VGNWHSDEVSDIGKVCYGRRGKGRCLTALWSWLGLEFDSHDFGPGRRVGEDRIQPEEFDGQTSARRGTARKSGRSV
jgi:hypothetical protein